MTVRLLENRQVMLVDGAEVFRIDVTCSEYNPRTDLPDDGLFVFQIFDYQTPSSDGFIRISTINDFENMSSRTRDQAARSNTNMYRTNSLVKDYNTLDVAVSAVTAISDRVNTLVNDFATYKSQFKRTEVASDKLYFPTVDPTVQQAAIATYQTASADYQTKLADQAVAATAKGTAETNLNNLSAQYTSWKEISDEFAEEKFGCDAQYNECVTVLDAVDPPGGGVLLQPDWYARFETATKVTYTAVLGKMVGTQAKITALINGLFGNAQAAVVTADNNLKIAQGATQFSYDALRTAYRDVKSKCPAWKVEPPFPALPSP